MTTTTNLTQITTNNLVTPHIDNSIFSLIMSADFTGKLVFILLSIASIVSWAIIISKYISLSNIRNKMEKFEELFWHTKGIGELTYLAKTYSDNPLSHIFTSTIKECQNMGATSENMKSSCKDRVICVMNLIKEQEMQNLERNLDWLATIGSASPFIGLFGTVWGIMSSFQAIAYAKNTTLAVVAPGIAEALLATAIGLFAAIPATIFYNYFTNKIMTLDNYMQSFSSNLYLVISKAIDKEEI
ncbi:MAG: protein TolQ [Rickettsiaceae bacterium]|nr:protein TolQ [Rickettsiaceae bacterium]